MILLLKHFYFNIITCILLKLNWSVPRVLPRTVSMQHVTLYLPGQNDAT